MHKTGQELLKLMFRPGENVCVSPNIYGYHSLPLESLLGDEVKLLNTKFRDGADLESSQELYKTDALTLVALNPIKGWRNDESVTAYRNFLVEMDYGPLPEQIAYAKTIGLPYSAIVFSGNKSLHFLISLDQDLPSYEVYYMFAEWMLKIASAADQNTKNPSRSIRIPGAYREPGKKQLIVEMRGPVPLQHFANWLGTHPDAKPKVAEKRTPTGEADFSKLKPWVVSRLSVGVIGAKSGRNKEWYAIAYEFALAGYTEDDTIEFLGPYFNPDRDFKEREWKTCIKSAFKGAYSKKD
jgi:hypothetical protein